MAFLTSTITALGGTPAVKPAFDFTANGTFSDVFTNYQTFLTLSQGFEDTGVLAYKGRAADLVGSKAVLLAALQIHSVEARHASMVRRLRGERGWINLKDANSGVPPAVYAGEDNTTQGGVVVTSPGTYSAATATEAFDEPLDPTSVTAIASLFIKP